MVVFISNWRIRRAYKKRAIIHRSCFQCANASSPPHREPCLTCAKCADHKNWQYGGYD